MNAAALRDLAEAKPSQLGRPEPGPILTQKEAANLLRVSVSFLRASGCPKHLLPGNGLRGKPLVRYLRTRGVLPGSRHACSPPRRARDGLPPGARPTYYLTLPTRTGWVQRSTGVDRSWDGARHRADADRAGPATKARLGSARRGPRRHPVSFASSSTRWSGDDLDGLRGSPSRRRPHGARSGVGGLARGSGEGDDQRSLPGARAHPRAGGHPFWRSALTGPMVAKWLATRTSLARKRRKAAKESRRREDPAPRPVSGSTKRRYLVAVQSFVAYLREIGVLDDNPIRDVSPPPAAPPRCQFLEPPDVIRLVEGPPRPIQALYALAYGAGLEISAILALVESDLDPASRHVRGRGTKASTRDRLSRDRRLGVAVRGAALGGAPARGAGLPRSRSVAGRRASPRTSARAWARGFSPPRRAAPLGRAHGARGRAARADRAPARAPRRHDGGEGLRALQAGHGGARSVGADRGEP